MLNISFQEDSDRRLVETLQAKGPALIVALTVKLNALMIRLQSYIVTSKLSGQLLRRQSGKLAGSIRAIPAQLEGTQIIGAIEGGGGPAFYGKFYEYTSAGGTGGTQAFPVFAVKARALAFLVDGKTVFAKRVMHSAIGPRPFMTEALDEKAPEIDAELQSTLDEEIDKP
jgi:hypothetical protein